MENGEKCTFCTHDDQHGDRHSASHDVDDVSCDPTIINTNSSHFVKVAFATGGMEIASEAVKGLKHSSLTFSSLFSHTNIATLTWYPRFYNTINRDWISYF